MYKMDRLSLFLYTKYKLDVCQKYLGEAFLVQHVHHHHLAIDDRRADGTTAKFPAPKRKEIASHEGTFQAVATLRKYKPQASGSGPHSGRVASSSGSAVRLLDDWVAFVGGKVSREDPHLFGRRHRRQVIQPLLTGTL